MKRGIDISHWQGGIDYEAVKNDVDFVILKAGGSDSGFYEDSMFREYLNGFNSVGCPILGAYYFVGSGFISYGDGVADADRFCDMLDGTGLKFAFLDLESTNPSDKEGVTDASIAFMDRCIERGYQTMIYASDVSGFCEKLNIDRLSDYRKWVARYGSSPDDLSEPQYVSDYTIWQYTSQGSVNGIGGNVDMDYLYDDSLIGGEFVSGDDTGTADQLGNERARGIVQGLYDGLLRRDYGYGENEALVDMLNNGLDVIDAFNGILESEEYQKKRLIRDCYYVMRGCEPSSEELHSWFQYDVDTIKHGILYSEEFNNKFGV